MSDRLTEIEHIVVLMLENRSFDHMLGYLSLEGGRADVDGLTGNEENEFNDKIYNPRRMQSPTTAPDPCHEWECVEEQLGDGDNSGFIRNYGRIADNPQVIMNYYNAEDVPVYDHLAAQFTICDRWFSSLPGATQPNRAYALAGTSDGHHENFSPKDLLTGRGFEGKTIFEVLEEHGVGWKCYTHDIAALRFFRKYRTKLERRIDKFGQFKEDARNGTLPSVSWIDPDFGIAVYPGAPNDDHPSHDVRHGQNFVSEVYNALLSGGNNLFSRTLLIITYDEHGGFYDHVSPRQFTAADDHAELAAYGVRVPAFVVSPWAAKGVAYGSQSRHLRPEEVVFDHTSILKTILRRFCTPAGGDVPKMTARVDAANDLGALLTEQQPRTDLTAAPSIEGVPTKFIDIFRMSEAQNDLKEALDVLVVQARAAEVPADKL